ncbi:esterase-like activity of phytase family protein [Actinomadura sp. DC4]|uniref:esterase-like activity of phytase family protein n=1 Tax=Actinomadura sp. DC4 TaxID=3055069 RepID=UPI0025B1B732|nr:esterase-like activity of phytase family protein [Actinomadura sp. DC4]MDN3355579.1 esterase-like activity of phytase family protein [Actinomadura sp. DC4]
MSIAVPSAEASTTTACSPWANITGFSDSLDKTTLGGVNVAELSGLTYDTNGHLLAVADESYLFTLDARTKKPLAVQTLVDENGQSLDSEAVAVDRDGTRLVTDETQPSILRFTRSGKVIDRLPVPASLLVAPAGRATHNLTFEGMTLQPGDRTLVASMEGALTGDNADVRRLQTWHRTWGEFRLGAQYAYSADTGLNISDITATGDGRLLVLERGYTPNVGNTVRVYLADLSRATDVSRVEDLTGQPGVRLARKTLIADIGACPSLGATTKQPQPNPLLDNIEGITVTGRTRDGRLGLLLVSDDNESPTQITRLYSLAARLPR